MALKGTRRVKIKKGDTVVVIAGKDYNRFVKKGKNEERAPLRGRVLEVSPTTGKVKVEGAGIVKRHYSAKRRPNKPHGIIEQESWIDISNVMVVDPSTGEPSKVRFDTQADGKKIRVAVASGTSLEK